MADKTTEQETLRSSLRGWNKTAEQEKDWRDRDYSKTTELGAVETLAREIARAMDSEAEWDQWLPASQEGFKGHARRALASLTPADLAPEGHVAIVVTPEEIEATTGGNYEARQRFWAKVTAALHDKGERE